MGKDSKISWTHHTFNPWWGCSPVSPGCDNCYAAALAKRMGKDCFGDSPRRFFDDAHWQEPLKWDRAAQHAGERHRVFCASMGDVFEAGGDLLYAVRQRLFGLICDTPHLDWLLLTKRPEFIELLSPPGWVFHGFPRNVWLGVTVESQEMANARIPILLQSRAHVYFASVEPMLGPIDLTNGQEGRWDFPTRKDLNGTPIQWTSFGHKYLPLDWVICGGESGPKARPMHPDWVRSLRDQCVSAGTPFFFKQWGTWYPDRAAGPNELVDARKEVIMSPDGRITSGICPYADDAVIMKKMRAADHLLDGREWRQFPGGGVA